MKRKYIIFLQEIFVTQFNHWSFFPLFAVLAASITGFLEAETPPGVYLWPLLGIFPFLCFLLRNYIRNIFLLLAGHGALVGLVWLLPADHPVLKALYMAAAGIYTVYSLACWLMSGSPQDDTVAAPVTVVVAMGSLYLLHYQKMEGWNPFFILSVIGTLGIYLLICYVNQYLNFLLVNDSSAGHIPEREIFFSGMGMVMGYTFLGMLILLLSANVEWMRGILSVLKQGLLLLFRLLAMLFPDEGESVPPPVEEPASGGSGEMLLPVGKEEPALLWVILEQVVMVLALAAFAVLLYKLSRKLIRFIRERIHQKIGIRVGPGETVMDVREKCTVLRKNTPRKREAFHLFPSASQRIRQLYRRKIIASRYRLTSSGELEEIKSLTAEECASLLEAQAMAQLYEQARYSNLPCSSEEVRQMKDACSR